MKDGAVIQTKDINLVGLTRRCNYLKDGVKKHTAEIRTYKWNTVKARNKVASRKTVGIFVTDEQGRDRLFFTEEFLQERPELKQYRVYYGDKREFYAIYSEKIVDQKQEQELLESKTPKPNYAIGEEGDEREIGLAFWYMQIAGILGLDSALYASFKKRDTLKLLALALFAVSTGPEVSFNIYCDWALAHWLPCVNELSPSVICQLFNRINEKQVDKFLCHLIDYSLKREIELCRAQGNEGKLVICIHVDSTSISTYANDMSEAQYGYNKDDDKLKQINIMMATFTHSITPFAMRKINGNTPDVSAFESFFATIKQHIYGSKIYQDYKGQISLCIVLDKGFASKSNITEIMESEFDFVLNIPMSFEYAKEALKSAREANFRLDLKNFLYDIKQHYYCSHQKSFSLDTESNDKKQVSFHVYCNSDMYLDKSKELLDKVASYCDKFIKSGLSSPDKDSDEYKEVKDLVRFDEQKGELCICADGIAKIAERESSMILATRTKDINPSQIYQLYQQRARGELVFRSWKDSVDNRLRISKSKQLQGRLLVYFLATCLKQGAQYLVNEAKTKVMAEDISNGNNELTRKYCPYLKSQSKLKNRLQLLRATRRGDLLTLEHQDPLALDLMQLMGLSTPQDGAKIEEHNEMRLTIGNILDTMSNLSADNVREAGLSVRSRAPAYVRGGNSKRSSARGGSGTATSQPVVGSSSTSLGGGAGAATSQPVVGSSSPSLGGGAGAATSQPVVGSSSPSLGGGAGSSTCHKPRTVKINLTPLFSDGNRASNMLSQKQSSHKQHVKPSRAMVKDSQTKHSHKRTRKSP